MRAQTHLAIGLAALIGLGWGCSGPGNVAPTRPFGASGLQRERDPVKIRQFHDLPNYPPYYFPTALAVGPDGALWVCDDIDQDAGQSAVARITKSGDRTKTFYYQNYASPWCVDIAAGPDGALWISDSADGQILRMTTSGTFTSFPLDGAGPEGIVSGPDHAMWFVENYFEGTAVARITMSGQLTTFTAGLSPGAALQDITVGPDGALWFTETSGDRVGRITKRGKITEYSAGITQGSQPYSIVSGPDGALWFTELKGGRISRITTRGSVTEYAQGISAGEGPVDLAAGPDGAIWFTEYAGGGSFDARSSRIGRITTSGQISEYHLSGHSGPTTIVQGPGGRLWFAESDVNRLGRVDI